MSKFLNSLFGRVVVALILGIALGAFFPHFAESLRPLGDGFLKLIKMVIGPIVFCVVVSGMANAGDLKKVGRVGLKAVIYFEIMTTLALGIGLVLAWLTRPGVGMNIDLRSLDASSLASYAKNAESLKDTAGYLMKIIPETAIDAFAKGDILQILVFAVLFGSALSLLGDKAQRVNSLIEELSHVFFRIIGFIIKLAPLGVLGAIAFTTGKYGVASLKQLGYLVAVFYLSCFVFVTVVLGAVMRLAGFGVQADPLPARGTVDRARHGVVGRGAAAGDAQARIHGREGFDGRPRDPDRLFVQPRRLLDLPDARGAVHRAGYQHAAVDA